MRKEWKVLEFLKWVWTAIMEVCPPWGDFPETKSSRGELWMWYWLVLGLLLPWSADEDDLLESKLPNKSRHILAVISFALEKSHNSYVKTGIRL